MTRLLLYVRLSWSTQWCPRVAFCLPHGTLRVFLLDSTWRRGSTPPGIPDQKKQNIQEQTQWQLISSNSHQILIVDVSHLGFISWFDVNVFSINVAVNVLIWMDELQHIQLQDKDMPTFILGEGLSLFLSSESFWTLTSTNRSTLSTIKYYGAGKPTCNVPHMSTQVLRNIDIKTTTRKTDTHYSTGELKDSFFCQSLIFFLHDRLKRLAHVGKNKKPI